MKASLKRNDGIVQFIVHSDDPGKAAAFYKAVFGWKVTPLKSHHGHPPGLIIDNAARHRRVLRGHIRRREASEGISGFECIVSVASLSKVAAAVRDNGGLVLEDVPFMPTVGGFLRFRDPDGNVVQAFQFANELRGKARDRVQPAPRATRN